jgi:phage terminase large subunit GpA-like protein
MSESVNSLIRIISPPSRLRCSEFAEAEIYLPASGDSAEPGRYHSDRMPWQMDMLDDVHDRSVSEYIWMLGSQLGKTLSILIIICFFVKARPKKILVVYPKLDDARDWMRDKLIPMVDESPTMRGIIKEPRDYKSKSRDLNRKFPGGGIVAVGSISTSSLRRLSAGVVIQDEIDDFETTGQGDSMELADLRAATFTNRFLLKSSTPTNAGESRVDSKFQASDQQHYFLPCLCCGEFFALELKHLKFSFSQVELDRFTQPGFEPKNFTWNDSAKEIRAPEKTIIVCEHCHRGWSDQDRIAAIRSGHPNNPPVIVAGRELRAHWMATAASTRIRGRRLPGFYRLIGKPQDCTSYLHWFADLFLTAKRGGMEKLRVWTNTFDARVFEIPAESLDWNPIHRRSEDYSAAEMPPQVVLVVGGVDLQQDRVEILICGFGDGEEAWLLEYHVVWGRFDLAECQVRVDEILLRKFKHPILGELPIAAVGMDTGHQTRVKEAYQFCKAHGARNVWAFKGSPHPMASVYAASDNRFFGIKLFAINTDFLKTTIYDRLKNQDAGPRYVHFPKGAPFDEKFYQMLCSEKRRSKKVSGETVYFWDKITQRNEVLDMMVYIFGAFDILKPQGYIARQWAKVKAELAKAAVVLPEIPSPVQPPKEMILKKPAQAPRRSGWFEQERKRGFVKGWRH